MGRLWNRVSRWENAGLDWYAATDVRLGWVLVEFERLDWEWLVAMCRDATCVSNGCLWNRVSSPVMMYCDDTDVCLERVLVHFGANHVPVWKTGPAHPT